MVCSLKPKQAICKQTVRSNAEWIKPCADYLNPKNYNPKRNKNKNLKKGTVSFIDKLHYELCQAASNSGCIMQDQAVAWYQIQKENRAAKLGLKTDFKSEPECQVNTFIAKNKDDRIYISPELKRYINEHDERVRTKQYHYVKATGLLRRSRKTKTGYPNKAEDYDAYKPFCTCGEIIERESLVDADPNTGCYCWVKQKWTGYEDEPSDECVCATDVKSTTHCEHCEVKLRKKLGGNYTDEYNYNNEQYYNAYNYEGQPYNRQQPLPYWVGTVGNARAFHRQTGGENKNIILKRQNPKSCMKTIKETNKLQTNNSKATNLLKNTFKKLTKTKSKKINHQNNNIKNNNEKKNSLKNVRFSFVK